MYKEISLLDCAWYGSDLSKKVEFPFIESPGWSREWFLDPCHQQLHLLSNVLCKNFMKQGLSRLESSN